MLRDFREHKTTLPTRSAEEIEELFAKKGKMEAEIVRLIGEFESEYHVIIDRVNFHRQITRTPSTIYTDLSLLVE